MKVEVKKYDLGYVSIIIHRPNEERHFLFTEEEIEAIKEKL